MFWHIPYTCTERGSQTFGCKNTHILNILSFCNEFTHSLDKTVSSLKMTNGGLYVVGDDALIS